MLKNFVAGETRRKLNAQNILTMNKKLKINIVDLVLNQIRKA